MWYVIWLCEPHRHTWWQCCVINFRTCPTRRSTESSCMLLYVDNNVEVFWSVIPAPPPPLIILRFNVHPQPQLSFINARSACLSFPCTRCLPIVSMSTTNYLPFDSEAPAAFRLSLSYNYITGEWCWSTISTRSYCAFPAPFLVQIYSNDKFA